jgi:putative Mg2+ transporter-C (MgtC) family protein
VDWTPAADPAARLAIAAVLGLLVGLEREHRGHDAGARTFALLCCGAALFTVASVQGFDRFGPSVDATRIAAQVVVGVGFLGAGLIFRDGVSVQNLTTAAALWVTAAVGVAAGAGEVGLAAAATTIVLALLLIDAERLLQLIPGRQPRTRMTCQLRQDGSVDDLRASVARHPGTSVDRWEVAKHRGQPQVHLVVRGDASSTEHLIADLVDDDRVEGIQLRS